MLLRSEQGRLVVLISGFGEETEIDQYLNVACIVNLGIRSRPVSLVAQIEPGLRGGLSLLLRSPGSVSRRPGYVKR